MPYSIVSFMLLLIHNDLTKLFGEKNLLSVWVTVISMWWFSSNFWFGNFWLIGGDPHCLAACPPSASLRSQRLMEFKGDHVIQ